MNLRSEYMLPVYIHIFTNSTLKNIYIYICTYIMYISIFGYTYTHTHIYIYIYQKNGGKVAQPRNTQLRHFVLAHPCSA